MRVCVLFVCCVCARARVFGLVLALALVLVLVLVFGLVLAPAACRRGRRCPSRPQEAPMYDDGDDDSDDSDDDDGKARLAQTVLCLGLCRVHS